MSGLRSPHHAYTSSDDSIYDRVNSLSRSESGTSQTHYDELSHDPTPKALMDDYIRDDFDMDRPLQTSNGFRRSRTFDGADPMAMHLLLETAVDDSQQYEILSPEQLDRLKKEEASVDRKIEALKKKLFLEAKVRNAAQSINRLNPKDAQQRTDHQEYVESTRKCEDMAQELLRLEREKHTLESQRLRHTAAVLQMDHQRQKTRPDGTQANGWRNSDDWGTGFGMMPLADTSDGIMDLPELGSGSNKVLEGKIKALNESYARLLSTTEHARALPQESAPADEHLAFLEDGLARLQRETDLMWNALESSADARRQAHAQAGPAAREASTEEFDDDDEPFSMQAFSRKVQRLCDHATSLSSQHYVLHDQHASLGRSHEAEVSQINDRHQTQLAQLQEEVSMARSQLNGAQSSQQSASRLEEEVKTLGARNDELSRELEVLAAGHQTSSSKLEEEVKTLGARNNELGRELHELVTEHEALVQQGVESERERENLENTNDTLREKLEALEVRINEERVQTMGAPAEGSKEPTSLSVMRTEFKKMMREARAEHFRGLRAEQEERRRLEALIRSLRKDHSASALASPSTLSPAPLGKSGLSRSVTAA